MELEQRIKSLEYEVQVLKNELQRVLLEIQEQVLIHHYPGLKSVENSSSQSLARAVEGLRKKSTETEKNLTPHPAKRISLEQERTMQERLHVPPSTRPPFPSQVEMDARLSEWVSSAVTSIGQKRTTRLVEGYARKYSLSPTIKASLLELVPASDQEEAKRLVTASEMLTALLELSKALGQETEDVETVLSIIEEASLG